MAAIYGVVITDHSIIWLKAKQQFNPLKFHLFANHSLMAIPWYAVAILYIVTETYIDIYDTVCDKICFVLMEDNNFVIISISEMSRLFFLDVF